jgi:hypothetical protein
VNRTFRPFCLIAASLVSVAGVLWAEEETAAPPPPIPPVTNIIQRIWEHRVQKDFLLKARLFEKREDAVSVDILIKNLPDEVRTIYRTGGTELLVIQSEHKLPRYYLAGTGELKGKQREARFANGWLSYYDLGMPFLYWPNMKATGWDRTRGQECWALEATADGEPYHHVKIWIHSEYYALLRVDAFDVDNAPVKRISIGSFRRLAGDVWIPRSIDFAFIPAGQALPASEKSRLEIYEGNYDARLPLDMFQPERFAPKR